MAYTISNYQHARLARPASKKISALSRFLKWADSQDKPNHVGWVGISVMAVAAVFFPATMAVILLNGALFGLIIAAMASFVMIVVANLAALPTRYTIPLLLLGILADVVIAIIAFL